MLLKIWFVLIYGFVNYARQIRAEDEKKKCPAHEKWTVFQRRKHGNVDFSRGWDDYVNGFGNCNGDLWLGLESLHQMTKGNDTSLEINMVSKDEKDYLWAKYRNFRIGSGSHNYTLHVSGFSGNVAADGLVNHNNEQFSTKDADHDGLSSYRGGWWQRGGTNLNANFNETDFRSIRWWFEDAYANTLTIHVLCCSEMKVYKRLAAVQNGPKRQDAFK